MKAVKELYFKNHITQQQDYYVGKGLYIPMISDLVSN